MTDPSGTKLNSKVGAIMPPLLPIPLKLAVIPPLPMIFYHFYLDFFMTLRAVLASLPLPMPLILVPALPLPMPHNLTPALPLPMPLKPGPILSLPMPLNFAPTLLLPMPLNLTLALPLPMPLQLAPALPLPMHLPLPIEMDPVFTTFFQSARAAFIGSQYLYFFFAPHLNSEWFRRLILLRCSLPRRFSQSCT